MTPFPDACSPLRVMELRQYTLHPGQRDAMIELFERKPIERERILAIAE